MKARGATGFTSLAVGSPNGAWAVATRSGNDKAELLAFHWNGRSWKRAAVPGGFSAPLPWETDSSQAPLSASSGRNAWLLDPGEFAEGSSPYDCEPAVAPKIAQPSRLARWNGSRFVAAGTFKDVVITSVVATGRSGAWAFGATATGPVTLRYDGNRWVRSASTLSVARATRVNGTIWAYGEKSPGMPVVARLVGGRWRTSLTSARLGAALPTKKTDGRLVRLTSIAPLPGGQVMVGGVSLFLGTCSSAGSETWRSFLYRWTGKTWRREQPKLLKEWTLTEQVPDGRGGTYALATRLWPAGDSHPDVKDLFHRTSTGRWTRLPLGRALSGVKTIASMRTRLLAAGYTTGAYDTNAALWSRP